MTRCLRTCCKDLRRARAAGHNMIPTKTGAAAAVGLVLPHLGQQHQRLASVPCRPSASRSWITFVAKPACTVDEVNKAVKQACDGD